MNNENSTLSLMEFAQCMREQASRNAAEAVALEAFRRWLEVARPGVSLTCKWAADRREGWLAGWFEAIQFHKDGLS